MGGGQRSPRREARDASASRRGDLSPPKATHGRKARRYLRPPCTTVAHGSGQASSQPRTSWSRLASQARPERRRSLTTERAPVSSSSHGDQDRIRSIRRSRAEAIWRHDVHRYPLDPDRPFEAQLRAIRPRCDDLRPPTRSRSATTCPSTASSFPTRRSPCPRPDRYGQSGWLPTCVAEEGSWEPDLILFLEHLSRRSGLQRVAGP